MGKIKFALTSVIFWMILIISIYFVENVPYVVPDLKSFDNLSFIIISLLLIGLITLFYVLEHKKNGLKIDFVLLPILTIVLVCGIISIWNNPEKETIVRHLSKLEELGPVDVTIPIKLKVQSSIQFFFAIVISYGLFFVYSRKLVSLKTIKWFIALYLLYTIVSIAFSFILQFENYKALFTKGEAIGEGIRSFYTNENIFAFGLLLAMIACIIYNLIERKWWSYILLFVFYIFIILVTSLTALLSATVLLTLFLLVDFFSNFKKHPWKCLITSIVLIFISITSICLLTYSSSHDLGFISSFYHYVNSSILNKDFSTLSKRTEVWTQTQEIIFSNNIFTTLFGRGYHISNYLLKSVSTGLDITGISTAHSSFLMVLLTYGIVGLILYIVALLYYFYVLVSLFVRKERVYAFTYLVCFLAVIIEGCFETHYLGSFNLSGLTLSMIVVIPPIVKHKSITHSSIVEQFKCNEIKKPRIPFKTFIGLLSYILTLIMFVCISVLILPYTYHSQKLVVIVVTTLMLSVLSLPVVPYLFSLFHLNSTLRRCLLRIALYSTVQGSLAFLIYHLSFNVFSNLAAAFIGIPLCYIFVEILFLLIYEKLIKHDKVDLFSITFSGCVFVPSFAPFITFILGTVPFLLCSFSPNFHNVNFMLFIIYEVILYVVATFLLPFKANRRMLENINNCYIRKLHFDNMIKEK